MRFRRPSNPLHQRVLPFLDRRQRLERLFKTVILLVTLTILVITVFLSPRLRHFGLSSWDHARIAPFRLLGQQPPRSLLESLDRHTRSQSVRDTRASLSDFYNKLESFGPKLRHLFDVARLDPDHVLIGSGRADNAFILSPGVFELDHNGRSYRLKPNTRALWVRQIKLAGAPFGLFLVPDTPEVRAAARAARAQIDLPSRQTTNSWGLRGPEPDPSAALRGLVLGDSFMLGMLNGDADTPPADLQRVLPTYFPRLSVSVLNTGLMGYSPRQYYFTLRQFGPRFKPHFVVVHVCPNDFGNETQVMLGRGADWNEAGYWLNQIRLWCLARSIPCLLVPVPCDVQFSGSRRDAFYPGRVCNLWNGPPASYCDLLPTFLNEHLRTQRLGHLSGFDVGPDALHNTRIADGHLSPLGAHLWARLVAYRLSLILDPPSPHPSLALKRPSGPSDRPFQSKILLDSRQLPPGILGNPPISGR